MFNITRIDYEDDGDKCFDIKEYKKAIGYYTRALAYKPGSSMIHYKLGNVYNLLEGYDQAMLEYNKALSIDPLFRIAMAAKNSIINRSLYHCREGLKCYQSNNFYYAILSYKKSLKLMPGQIDAHLGIAKSYAKISGFEDSALHHLRIAVSMGENGAETYYDIGSLYAGLGYAEYAMEAYKEAVIRNPNFYEAYNGAAMMLVRQKRYDEAVVVYKKLKAINPGSESTCSNIIDLLIHTGRSQEALKECGEILSYYPDFTYVREQYDKLNLEMEVMQKNTTASNDAGYFSWLCFW